MVSVLIICMVVLLLNVSLPADVDESIDEDLVRGFRDLFSAFLQPTSSQQRAAKHARDTSRVDQNAKVNQTTGRRPAVEPETDRPKLLSLYHCDYEDVSERLCVNVRQLGTTLTVGVRVQGPQEGREKKKKSPIRWYRVFKLRGQSEQRSLSFNKLSRGNLPWNINLGGDDDELRISPITETDFGYNFFLATIDEKSPQENMGEKSKDHLQFMMFRIEPLSIDMGTLYHGEEITIDVRSHMELPSQSVQYEWARIGPTFEVVQNLPSNMRLSRDGSSLVIKEHMSHGDMVLTCAVFSNKNFTLARRNFLLKRIVSYPNSEKKSRISRKRRYLEEFYARPNWNSDHFSKTKRSSSFKRDNEQDLDDNGQQSFVDWDVPPNQTPVPDDFPETSSFQQPTFPYEIVDTPEETVLKFYENPTSESQLDTDVPIFSKVSAFESGKQESKSLKGLIQKANDMVELEDDDEEIRHSTTKFVAEEKPTFEDRESMMIADCNADADCGINAVCIRIGRDQKFCKCLPHYRGNGMFCWLY